MPRSRRSVLATLVSASGVGLAGCGGLTDSATRVATESDDPSAGRKSDRSAGDRTPCGPQRVATAQGDHRFDVAFETQPADGAIAVEGAVASAPTDRQPAHLALAVRNRQDDEVSIQFGHAPPLSGLALSNDATNAIMELWPVEPGDELGIVDRNDDGEHRVVPSEPTDGCWRAEDHAVVPDYFVTRTLSVCDAFERRFRVLAHPDNDGCLPSGTYRRTDDVTMLDAETTLEATLAITVS